MDGRTDGQTKRVNGTDENYIPLSYAGGIITSQRNENRHGLI